jgi:hypothetical protein
MTPTQIAQKNGMTNVASIIKAAAATHVPLPVALALFEKETHGRNIYGHDVNGALSTHDGPVTLQGKTYPKGSNIPVTPSSAGIFLLMIGAGAHSNGMGPAQITYAGDLPDGRTGGYFRQMLERGLRPWVVLDNMTFGLERLRAAYDSHGRSWQAAGTAYNGKASYGKDLAKKITTWSRRLA